MKEFLVHKTEDTIVDAGLDNDISLREGDIGTRAVNPDGSLENKPNSFEDGFPLDKQTEDINATKKVRFTMEGLFFGDWQSNSFQDTVPRNLTEAINNRRYIKEASESTSRFELDVWTFSRLLKLNGYENTEVFIIDFAGKKEMVTLTQMGEDFFMTIANEGGRYIKADETNQDNADFVWYPHTTYILSGDTKAIFSLGKLINKIPDEVHELGHRTVRYSIPSEKYQQDSNYHAHLSNTNDTIISFKLPQTIQDLAGLLHESGHMVRHRMFQIMGLEELSVDARKKYNHPYFTPVHYDGLNDFDARQIVANEERGAWAIALSISRELIKRGIRFGDQDAEKTIAEFSQWCLDTYDKTKYHGEATDDVDSKVAPSFSDETRKERRKLLDDIEKNLATIFRFDPETGERIDNDPKRMRGVSDEIK
ncbi:MAG: hypothetical protein A2123_03280 [Candidatus Zambryskibacteria bacterium GWB1_40_5]|nr:MAG: hypothetical protein A2123_03280 [Candidatus Zambryskibacteria bacterium GWB1_40_5]